MIWVPRFDGKKNGRVWIMEASLESELTSCGEIEREQDSGVLMAEICKYSANSRLLSE